MHLANLPTPLQRFSPGHSDAIPSSVGPAQWIKRDDMSHDVYGGGKVRKLEWALAQPEFQQTPNWLSVGATGSHHLLATAYFARELGYQLHALVFSQTPTLHVRQNFAALVSLGTRIYPVHSRIAFPLAYLRSRIALRGDQAPQYLSAGASTPAGCVGFIQAALELAQQMREQEIGRFDRIYLPVGTAGTAVGLAIGLALARVSTHLSLVSTVEPWFFNRAIFQYQLHRVWRYLQHLPLASSLKKVGVAQLLARSNITWSIDHRFAGAGYGVPTRAGEASCRAFHEVGVELEPTYTAKCAAAFQFDCARQERDANQSILYWHTHARADTTQLIEDNWRERLAIKLWSGWPTFPQVFVKGALIGGFQELKGKLDDGSLKTELG